MSVPPFPLPLPDPLLSDGDLHLRPWTSSDAPVLAAAWTDPEIARWTGVPDQHDEAAAVRWINGDRDRRARGLSLDLVAVVDDAIVGEVGLSGIDATGRTADIGWWVVAHRRGRGLATRAAILLADWAVAELSIDAVLARCHQDNPSSAGVARAAGFRPVGQEGPIELWSLAIDGGATLGP
ncbi:MAG TPA: GNAT family N-acetyltransferase [Acidimicrobiales bacterium]|nr:GNAT family N-acetyltransferase [Acidimicrobiales bacterium]